MTKDEQTQFATVAARMRELIGSPEWAVYHDAVTNMITHAVDQLLQAPSAQHDSIFGRINGLRDAISLPQMYITRAKQYARD